MFSDNEQKEIVKVLEKHNRLDLSNNLESKEVGAVLYDETQELTRWEVVFADVYEEYLLYSELGSRLRDPGCCHNLGLYYHYDSDLPYYDTDKEKAYFYMRKVIEFGGCPDDMILREMVDMGDPVAVDHFNNMDY
jgi:hypothetical protein